MEDPKEMLTPLLEGTDVPSLVAAVVVGGETRAAGAVGVRKRGDDTPVTVNDKYHLGSCVKAMTATLAGVLVEQGMLAWETGLREVFPDTAMHLACEAITLRQLLSHSSGLPAFTNPETEDAGLVIDRSRRSRDIGAGQARGGLSRTKPGASFAAWNCVQLFKYGLRNR